MPNQAVLRRAMDTVHCLNDPSPPWKDILTSARDLVGSDSASLLMFDRNGELLNLTQIGFEDSGEREYVAHYHTVDDVARDAMSIPAGEWMDTAEMYSQTQTGRSEFFVDFLWRHKMSQILGYTIEQSPQLYAGISFQRSTVDATTKAQLLRPEFSSYFQTLQMEMRRRQEAIHAHITSIDRAFSSFGDAICLLSAQGSVRWASERAKEILAMSGGLHLKDRTLRHPNRLVQTALESAIAQTVHTSAPQRLTLPSAWGTVVAVGVAIAGQSCAISSETLLLLRLTPRTVFHEPNVRQLEIAFPITNAEARCLAGLVSGHSVSEYAASTGLSDNTVRKHVAMLLRKMECSRQSELVKLALLVLS